MHDRLIGRSELTPLKDEEMESIFEMEAEKTLFAGIGPSSVHDANLNTSLVEKSVITNLRALVSCNFHGVSEVTQEIEVLPEKFKEIEEVNTFP
jgi:hypothetical protein